MHTGYLVRKGKSSSGDFVRLVFILLVCAPAISAGAEGQEWIVVSPDQTRFALQPSGKNYVPWGFNYDHDAQGRLLEDYWDAEWPTVVEDFQEMKALGANVVRIHLQVGKFMQAKNQPNVASLKTLAKLVALAEQTNLYLDLTGLGCYHKQDVPAWYDELNETERWDAQAVFWEAVAKTCSTSPAIFCYDLMNEPVVPAGALKGKHWLGPPLGDKHFVQWISRELKGRERPEVARQWIQRLTKAIRQQDRRHLITVGLLPWSLERPGLQSGFVPQKIGRELDFIAVHLYPKTGKLDESLDTLKGFAVGKPIVIEETFPLEASPEEFSKFLEQTRGLAAGWIGFYWGKSIAEYERGNSLADAITAEWLKIFKARTAWALGPQSKN